MKQLTDEELYAKTDEFRNRYKEGESLDKMLPEAFRYAVKLCIEHLAYLCSKHRLWLELHYIEEM